MKYSKRIASIYDKLDALVEEMQEHLTELEDTISELENSMVDCTTQKQRNGIQRNNMKHPYNR